jgi:hypothetical protein
MTITLAVALASTFNLICSGTAWHSSELLGPKVNERQFKYVYHVDLTAGRYCVGACTTTAAINKITDTMIIFDMQERSELDDTLIYVDRESGKYWDRQRRFIPQSPYW